MSVLGIEPVIANAAPAPCRDDSRSLLELPVPMLAVQAITAQTRAAPSAGGATSQAHVTGLDLGLLGVRADLVDARATVTCEAGQPRLSGTSSVVGLTVNGQPIPSTDSVDLQLAIGTLHVNHTSMTGDVLTRRAVWLETVLGSVVLGEAQAGFAGNPCAAGRITIVQESQPESGQVFSFIGDLGPFTLRDDGSSVSRRTFALPPGRYRVAELQPTGGRIQLSWFPSDVGCTDPDGGTTVDRAARTVQVDLDPGEDIVCTFVNSNAALANTGGDIDNPAGGADRPAVKVGLDSPPTSVSRVAIDPPTPPTTLPVPRGSPVPNPSAQGGGGGSLVATTGLVAIPLITVALLGGALWFLLAGVRRRRKEETA